MLIALGVAAYFGFAYRAPSCTDGKQDGTETGVDCGGNVCTTLCADQAPNISVEWARAVKVADGVYHAVALIHNPDTSAGGSFPYKVSLYDASNILIAERSGTFAIGPGEEAPLFEPNIATGARVPVRAFVDAGRGVWRRATRTTLPITVVSFALDATSTRLTATLENTTPSPISGTIAIALLYDAAGVLITASQAHVDTLPPRARTDVSFTWPVPFPALPAHIDIIPRVP